MAAAKNQVIFLNVFLKYFKTIFCSFILELGRTRPEVYEYEKNQKYTVLKVQNLQQKANELYLMFCDHRNVSKKLNA
jgi:hypothetical protein